MSTPRTFAAFIAAAAFASQPLATAHAQDDPYQAIGYLTNTQIDGNAMRGTTGVSGVNMAAGDFNQQANLRALAAGGDVSIRSRQVRQNNHSDQPYAASASIGGSAYGGGSGIASINQASGSENAQLNVVAAALASQGIRETTEGSLSAAVSASAGGQDPNSVTSHGTRSATVESSAMQWYQGVLQLNQAAGSGNATSNQLLLDLSPSPPR